MIRRYLLHRTAALSAAALLAVSGVTGCAGQNSASESAAAAGTAGEENAAAAGDESAADASQEGAGDAAGDEYWPVLAVSPGGAQFPDMNIVVPTTEAPPEYIRIGTRSWIVKDLQARLMELGFMDNDEPSEYYGEVTQAAVKIYQRQNHLAQDGIVGAETLAAAPAGTPTRAAAAAARAATIIPAVEALAPSWMSPAPKSAARMCGAPRGRIPLTAPVSSTGA